MAWFKGFKKFERVQGVIVAVSLLAFVMVLYSNWITLNMFKRSEGQDPLPETVQYAITASRLALERSVAGDRSYQLQTHILRYIDKALQMCRQSSQSRTGSDLLKPVDDRGVKAAAGKLTRELEELRKLSIEWFTKGNGSPEGDRIEKAYIKTHKEVMALTESARTSLVEVRNEEALVLNSISL